MNKKITRIEAIVLAQASSVFHPETITCFYVTINGNVYINAEEAIAAAVSLSPGNPEVFDISRNHFNDEIQAKITELAKQGGSNASLFESFVNLLTNNDASGEKGGDTNGANNPDASGEKGGDTNGANNPDAGGEKGGDTNGANNPDAGGEKDGKDKKDKK